MTFQTMTEIEKLRFQLSLLSLALGGKAPGGEWRRLIESAGKASGAQASPAPSIGCDTEPES